MFYKQNSCSQSEIPEIDNQIKLNDSTPILKNRYEEAQKIINSKTNHKNSHQEIKTHLPQLSNQESIKLEDKMAFNLGGEHLQNKENKVDKPEMQSDMDVVDGNIIKSIENHAEKQNTIGIENNISGLNSCFTIIKEKKKFFSKYRLLNQDNIEIFSAERKLKLTGSHFIYLSGTEEDRKVVAKSEGNFLGNNFALYDNGESPNNTKVFSRLRKIICHVNYKINLLKDKIHNRFKVFMPSTSLDNNPYIYYQLNSSYNLKDAYNSGENMKILCLENISEVEIPEKSKKSRNRNILIKNKDDKIILRFFQGINLNEFKIEMNSTFSILQAFFICLTSLDFRILS